MGHKYSYIATIILAAILLSGSSAIKGSFRIYQPDGTSFMAVLKGDEFGKVLMTTDGCAVIKDDDGFYRYAYFNPDGSKESSGYQVGVETPSLVLYSCRNIPWNMIRQKASVSRQERRVRSIAKPVTAATRSASTQSRNCLFILAQFQDVSFMNESTRRQDIMNIVNKEGNNSLLDYLNDQFQGSYEFHFTVGPIVTLSKDHDYYGKNNEDKAGQDLRPQELVREACILSDPFVDFSQFDDDDDGIVDNVFVIVAGKSEAEGGDPDCIWPHQWYVPNLVLDGTRVWTYALSTELTVQSRNSNGQLVWGLTNIGTLCHEYSHTLGLVDFYDTDEEGSGGISNGMWGSTDLMDSGNFNNNGKTPPYYNAVDREILGIGRRETMETGTYTLEPVNEEGHYLILENPNDSAEFFLFECRAQRSWDAYIGGSGLAIYHVDMSNRNAGWSDDAGKEVTARYRWENDEVNCNPKFECADMMETSSSAINVSQAFFPYRTVNSFNGNSSPSFTFNDGTPSPLAIANITRRGTSVSFVVYNSSEVVPNVLGLKAEVYQDAAIITWQSDVPDFTGNANVSWGETSGSRKSVVVEPYDNGMYSLTLEGLSPTTPYTVEVSFERNSVTGEIAVSDFLTKASQDGRKPFIYLEYLSGSRQGGKFLPGTGLPLRVFNAIGSSVSWTYDGRSVSPDGSGYFHPSSSGTLKAVVSRPDGTRDILAKEIVFTQ